MKKHVLMQNNDEISRFVIDNTDVRGMLVHLDETWVIARERMDYPEPARQVLGEAFAAAVLLSATIKFDGKLTLQVRGDGPVHLLVVQVTRDGAVRGLAKWKYPPDGNSMQEVFGDNARMTISVEADAAGLPHQGIVELVGAHLSEALENYFKNSEQLQTRLYLAVNDKAAAGMLLQKLPGSEAAVIHDDDGWDRCIQLANTLSDDELLQLDNTEILGRLYHQEQVRLFESEAIRFECSCSRDRTDGLIRGLGPDEANQLLQEQGGISITCEFCAAEYYYDSVDVEILFRDSVSGENPDTVH